MLVIGTPKKDLDLNVLRNTAYHFVSKLEQAMKPTTDKVANIQTLSQTLKDEVEGLPTPDKLRDAFLKKVGGEDNYNRFMAAYLHFQGIKLFFEMFERTELTQSHVNQVFTDLTLAGIEAGLDESSIAKLSSLIGFEVEHRPATGLQRQDDEAESVQIIENLLEVYSILNPDTPLIVGYDLKDMQQVRDGTNDVHKAINKTLAGMKPDAPVVELKQFRREQS